MLRRSDARTSRKFSGECIVGTVVVQPPKATNPCEYFRHAHVASFHQFAVEPSRRGEGIGTRLLDACEAWTLAHGCGETALDTAEQATHLITQYAKRGYAQCGDVQWTELSTEAL
jgi:GNAT superfamily N-acetyltransferase